MISITGETSTDCQVISQILRRSFQALPPNFSMLFARPSQLLAPHQTCKSLLSWFILMSYHIVKCLSQATSSSSFPDHLPFSYLFTHLVSVFLISFCPFFLFPQHLQLSGCLGHPVSTFLSCSISQLLRLLAPYLFHHCLSRYFC